MNTILLKNKLLHLRLFGSSLEYYLDYGIFVHLKFALARRLDKNPDYCWAHLVTWALRWNTQPWYQPLTRSGRSTLKSQICPASGSAWCGKCSKTGRV